MYYSCNSYYCIRPCIPRLVLCIMASQALYSGYVAIVRCLLSMATWVYMVSGVAVVSADALSYGLGAFLQQMVNYSQLSTSPEWWPQQNNVMPRLRKRHRGWHGHVSDSRTTWLESDDSILKRTTNTCSSSNLWMNSPLGFNVSACVWWGSAIQFLMYHGCSRHSLTNTSFPANSKGRIPTRSMCFPRLSGKQPARHWQTTVRYPVTPGQWSSLQSNQTLLPRWMATKIPSEGTPKGIHLSEGWIVCSQRPTP